MARYPRPSGVSYSFGPGPRSPAIKILIIVNVIAFLLSSIVQDIISRLGLRPQDVFEGLAFWQPVTYMFLHGGIGHLLFNMLALWMFGTDLERTWGTRFFTKYYFVTGIGAAVLTLLWSISPLPFGAQMYRDDHDRRLWCDLRCAARLRDVLPASANLSLLRVPGSGALLRDDHRRDHVLLVDRIGGRRHRARCASGRSRCRVLYLTSLRGRPFDELKYRWLRWKMNRARGRFDVYSGGRRDDDDSWKSDWKKHIH